MVRRLAALVVWALAFVSAGAGVSLPAVPAVAQPPAGSAGLCDTAGAGQFDDVGAADYGAAYILCMRALGLSAGFGDGNYGPNRELNRAQMATFLVQLWRLLGNQCPTGVVSPFTDVVAGSTHAEDIVCIYGLGITVGTSATTYGPQDRLKASHITLFLYRVYEKTGATACGTGTGSPFDRATACLLQLQVVPTQAEATASTPVTRAQMGVYVVGLWHNLSGRGLPPSPPRLDAATAVTPIEESTPTNQQIEQAESRMVDLVNQLRAGLGVAPLELCAGVATVARSWSVTMHATDRFEHNPDFFAQYPPGSLSGAENIAKVGYYGDLVDRVQQAFDLLSNSPGHYKNMTHERYSHIGVGIVVGGGHLWVTQNFARFPDTDHPACVVSATSPEANTRSTRLPTPMRSQQDVRRVVYRVTEGMSSEEDRRDELWIQDIDGANRRRIADKVVGSATYIGDGLLWDQSEDFDKKAFSPDRKLLAYLRNISGSGNTELWVTDGSSETKIAEGVRLFIWTVDGALKYLGKNNFGPYDWWIVDTTSHRGLQTGLSTTVGCLAAAVEAGTRAVESDYFAYVGSPPSEKAFERFGLWVEKLDSAGSESDRRYLGVPRIGRVNLFGTLVQSYECVWSPDGERLAYVKDGADGPELWIADMKSTSNKGLVTSGNPLPLRSYWSLDGSHFLYYQYQDDDKGKVDLWAMKADASDTRKLVDNFRGELVRDHVVYYTAADEELTDKWAASTDIWAASIDGSEQIKLATNASLLLDPYLPLFGHVSRYRLGYHRGREVWLVDVDGANRIKLADGVQNSRSGCRSVWRCPRGVGAAFELSPTDTHVSWIDATGLWVADAAGSNRVLLSSSAVNYWSWSPDGSRIAYSLRDAGGSLVGGSIWVADADGSNRRRMSDDRCGAVLDGWLLDGDHMVWSFGPASVSCDQETYSYSEAWIADGLDRWKVSADVDVGRPGSGYSFAERSITVVGFLPGVSKTEPEVRVTVGGGVMEGSPAVFTLTAEPAPSAALTVSVTVGQSGDYGVATGIRTITIPTSGTATMTVATTGDSVDEPDGSVRVALLGGIGYTVSTSQGAAKTRIADDDEPPPTPANVRVAGIGKTWVEVRWDEVADGFYPSMGINPAPGQSVVFEDHGYRQGGRVSNLLPGHTYTFRVSLCEVASAPPGVVPDTPEWDEWHSNLVDVCGPSSSVTFTTLE